MDEREEDYQMDWGDTRHKMRGVGFSDRKLVKKTHNAKYMRELAFQLEKRKKQSQEARGGGWGGDDLPGDDKFGRLDRKDLKAEKRKEARIEKKDKKKRRTEE